LFDDVLDSRRVLFVENLCDVSAVLSALCEFDVYAESSFLVVFYLGGVLAYWAFVGVAVEVVGGESAPLVAFWALSYAVVLLTHRRTSIVLRRW